MLSGPIFIVMSASQIYMISPILIAAYIMESLQRRCQVAGASDIYFVRDGSKSDDTISLALQAFWWCKPERLLGLQNILPRQL